MSFYLIFFTTVALTVLSGSAATAIAIFGRPVAGSAQKLVAEKLAQIALLGAGAIVTMLSRFALS